ncbi:carboxypeptidase-like regulatory domain-containing protein [Halioxenophilus sp. WMMB6]|uniref:carboxypeptidase-like regulatory domain-containing protein n=1 Tax=Halioxenophilus sp. WMMB6 TaxID=3073815 RepID=UPI00295F3D8E|nr:carboxypeptidase-like regulatory domain-containing protein [Halioxenophilus sp. WMMB6]
MLFALVSGGLTACGGGSSSSSGSIGDGGGSGGTTVTTNISGFVSYDSVPHTAVTHGLSYADTVEKPVRGATVQLLNGSGGVLDESFTDNNGNYLLEAPANTQVRVRVRAESISTGTASWDVSVRDNTSGKALYVLQGDLINSGTSDSVRDLHAASGWSLSANDYTGERAAAPFAILDTVYSSLQSFVAVDANINFPALQVLWSEDNIPQDGELTAGEIGTSFFTSDGNAIYLLGAKDSDTDEFDSHVIAHEWGHYFEANLSRSDSIGGSHTLTAALDMRLAFGEGWGNALSAMVLEDPLYVDSGGPAQALGFAIDVEDNVYSPEGWFNEGSVQSILYDIYDGSSDGSDNLNMGLDEIYAVLTSSSYINSELFTSIHLFIDTFKTANPSVASSIDALAAAQSITVDDAMGSTETNANGVSELLPIYTELNQGGTVQVCMVNDFGNDNKLGTHRYVLLPNVAGGSHTLTVARASGALATDPDFYLYRRGVYVTKSEDSVSDIESWSNTLTSGDYIMDVYDFENNDVCYNVSWN